MSEKMNLEMSFPVTNELIKSFNRTCCNWGQKKPPYDSENHVRGNTAPLWVNPSKTFYKVFFVFCLLCSFLFIGSFIAIQFYNNSTYSVSIQQESSTISTTTNTQNNILCVKKSYEYLRSWFIIIGSIILLLNAFYCLFMACVDYATDQEWSRYLFFNTILWCALVGFLIGDYLSFVQDMNFYNSDTLGIFKLQGTESCNQFFQVNLYCNIVVAAIISVLAILLIIKIILIARNFFLVRYVPHTASCEDEDIIVYG